MQHETIASIQDTWSPASTTKEFPLIALDQLLNMPIVYSNTAHILCCREKKRKMENEKQKIVNKVTIVQRIQKNQCKFHQNLPSTASYGLKYATTEMYSVMSTDHRAAVSALAKCSHAPKNLATRTSPIAFPSHALHNRRRTT